MANNIRTPGGKPMAYKVQELKAKTPADKIKEELKAKEAKKKTPAKKKAKK
jgi:hypothetical protein